MLKDLEQALALAEAAKKENRTTINNFSVSVALIYAVAYLSAAVKELKAAERETNDKA